MCKKSNKDTMIMLTKKTAGWIGMAFLGMSLILPGAVFAASAVRASVTVNVGDPNGTAKKLIQKAEALDGYYTLHADDRLKLSIPEKHVMDYIGFAEQQGIVTGKQFDSEDLSTQLILKKNSLSSKQKMLEEYLKVLKDAGNSKIVTVETEVLKLAETIENIKGEIRYIEHCTAYAKVDIFFSFHDRSAPVVKKESSFLWLNTMGLQEMIQGFQNE